MKGSRDDGVGTDAPRTPRRGPRALGLIAVFLFIVAIGWLGLGPASFDPVPIRLPDGNLLTLVSVQAGPRHYNPFQPLLRRWMGPVPRPWIERIGLRPPEVIDGSSVSFLGIPVPNDSLSLWFVSTNSGIISGTVIWIEDGSGWSSEAVPVKVRGTDADGRWIEFCLLKDVPRGAESLTAVVAPSTGDGPPITRFRVRHPHPRPSGPRFADLPLPQTVRDGEMAFTLERLSVQSHDRRSAGDRPVARATVSVSVRGQPARDWISAQLGLVEVSRGGIDASDMDANDYAVRMESSRRDYRFVALPTNEPWHLEAEFLRVRGFDSNEVWHVRGVPITSSFGYAPLAQTTLGKSRLQIRALMPGLSHPNNPNEVPRVVMLAQVESSADPGDFRIVVLRATDDLGRVAEPSHGNHPSDGFGFTVSPGAKTMDFDMAVSRVRRVSFTAQPVLEPGP